MPKPWMIYGANGYMGGQIAREAATLLIPAYVEQQAQLSGALGNWLYPLFKFVDVEARVGHVRSVRIKLQGSPARGSAACESSLARMIGAR